MIDKIKSLTSHAGFMKYFKNTSWMMAEQILRLVSGLFIGVWVARYLGPEKYGLLSYALAFFALSGVIASLGLDDIVIRDLTRYREKENNIMGAAFWLKFIGALLAFVSVFSVSLLSSNDAETHLYIMIIAVGMFFQSFDVIDFNFQSKVLSKYVSI